MTGAHLPFFSFSAAVMDSKFGKVKKVEGNFKLTMPPADAKKLAEAPNAKTAFAKALATSTGLPADDILITAIFLKVGGGNWTLIGARRLATSQVKVEYEILTTKPVNATAMSGAASQSALAAAVVKESKAIGVTVAAPTVVISAPAVKSVGTNAACKDATVPAGKRLKQAAKDTMCSGGVTSCVEATCFETLLCGNAMDVTCATGKFQDKAKNNMSRGADMGKTACCTMTATCKDVTCGAGMMANATAVNISCSGAVASCMQATCCSTVAATPPPGTDGAIAMFLPSLSAIIAAAGSLFFF